MSCQNRVLLSTVTLFLLLGSAAYATDAVVYGPETLTVGRWGMHLSVHRFSADAPGDGMLHMVKTHSNRKLRGGFVWLNGRFFSLSRFFRSGDGVLEKHVRLRVRNRMMVFMRGQRRAGIAVTVRARVQTPVPAIAFSVSPEGIRQGESAVLSWHTEHADACTIAPDVGAVETSGTYPVSPDQTTVYTLTAAGPGGTATAAATVTVFPVPTATLAAEPASILPGQAATLTWSSEHGESAVITPDVGEVAASGSVSVAPTETTTYALTVTGEGGTATAAATITVDHPAPTAAITAIPETLEKGQSATLSWNCTHADTVTIAPEPGGVAPAGSIPVTPSETTTYTLTATGPGGTATATATVTVTDPLPAVTFQVLPDTIAAGESATLAWHADHVESVVILPPPAMLPQLPPSGTAVVSPATTTIYTLIAGNAAGSVQESVTLTVSAPPVPVAALTALPETIDPGGTTVLTWQTQHASACSLEPGVGSVDTTGSLPLSPDRTTQYTLTATGPGGTASASVIVTVNVPPPTVVFEATPPEIRYLESATLSWSATDADACTIQPDIGEVGQAGSVTVSPAETTTYTLSASGPGGTATERVTVTVTAPEPEAVLSAAPDTIRYTESAQLTWSTRYADTCILEPGFGDVGLNGAVTVSPAETTTYRLNATGPGGAVHAETTVIVEVTPPEATLTIEPAVIIPGQSATLAWHCTYADTCTLEPDMGDVALSGTMAVAPESTTVYTLTAAGPGGAGSVRQTLYVAAATPAAVRISEPEEMATIDADTVDVAGTVAPPANAVWVNGEPAEVAGGVFIARNIPLVPGENRITASAFVADSTEPVRQHEIRVIRQYTYSPPPEGSFGDAYADLVPGDARVASYDPRRFAVVTGAVSTVDGAPLADVSVAVKDRPAYGTAQTGPDGTFSLPLDGGTTVTLVYAKAGLLDLHRQITVPRNDVVRVDPVRMSERDSLATTVRFSGDPGTVTAHRGSAVADAFGTRAATVTLSGDNRAFSVDEYGVAGEALAEITTRATTYASPEAMPAELPPTSAYTYCAELTVDGVERVQFEKPVILWVENFLGFDVGLPVPSGYYDPDRGVWVPLENGLVVRLLDADGDGTVDALDADGDGEPDDLNESGGFADETAGLDDGTVYPAGATFWRVPVSHFSTVDLNWPIYKPGDDIPPNPKSPPATDMQVQNDTDPGPEPCGRQHVNSYVQQRNRVFHEDIPIPGTGIALHYASSRVDGYLATITVPASGESVPASLKRIEVKVEAAGRIFRQTLDPLPNQKAEFVWDGLDYLGRPVKGAAAAHVSVGFVYEYYYAVPAASGRAFGRPGTASSGIPTQEEYTLWSVYKVPVTKGRGLIAEGWTLTPHHELHVADPTPLHKGDGGINTNINIIIDTVAGNGESDYVDAQGYFIGEGGPALEAGIGPGDIEVDAAGNLYFTDMNSVRRIDAEGVITRLAGGSEWSCWLTNNREATMSGLYGPTSIAVDEAGNLYIADALHCAVRKVDVNGIITTVAGVGKSCFNSGACGFAGDGGPAVEAQLNWPHGVALDQSGNLYISDHNNNRIRRVDTDGTITTVAGTGQAGFSGDGGPAVDAQISYPKEIAVDDRGNLYIWDYQNVRIRKVDTDGTITTVAGTGESGYTGDGGAATLARISGNTSDITVDSAGNLYIADTGNNCIRKVFPDGTITTIAGLGNNIVDEFGGDGGPASQAQMYRPGGVAVDAVGHLYIADSGNHRIRRVAPVMAFKSLIGAGEIPFAEAGGTGHITTGTGRHRKTVDLATGSMLRQFDYDGEGRLMGVTDPFGNRITVERDGAGMPTAILSPDGVRTALMIDADNHLTGIVLPDGRSYGFEYSPEGLMTAEIEPENNRFDHRFDAMGRLVQVSDEEGGAWRYSQSIDESGEMLTEVLSAEGLLTRFADRTDITGRKTATVTGPSGDQVTYSRSADGLTVTQTHACGTEQTIRSALDPQYRFKTVKSRTEATPAGLERSAAYDREYQDTDADTVPDRITDRVTVNGRTAVLENNALAGVKTLTTPQGRTAETRYDPATLKVQRISVAGLFDTVYLHDDRGRVTASAVDERETAFAYNADGFLASVTDPENRTTTFTYDDVGRVTAVHRPDGGTVRFAYDGNGNMTTLTNPMDVSHNFGFNGVNLKNGYTPPLSGAYTYIYDKDRRLVETRFPSGNSISRLYDGSRLMRILTPEAVIDMTYLCGGKVETVRSGPETIAYGYDGSLITSEALSGELNQTISYTYNNDFRISEFSYAGGGMALAYDTDGLLTGAGAYTIIRNSGNGLPEGVTGGAFGLDRTFNGHGEVGSESIRAGGAPLASWSVSRSRAGRIIAKTETVDGETLSYAYTYDAMGRLRTVTLDDTLVEEYDYDQNGTRVYEMNSRRGVTGRSYSYDAEDHLLAAGDTTYAHDADGFLTTKTQGADITAYDYSLRGELLGVDLPDGRTIDYLHDPLGRRIAKIIDGVTAEKYLWQGLTRLLAIYDGSGSLVMRFEYADGRMPVAMQKGGATYHLAYDQAGSLRAVADTAGNVVKRIDYDSFGNIIDDSNPTFTVPFGFAGGLHDRDTGLVRFGYRDYDPATGRWTAKDPIFFDGGDTDLYGYCLNDPVNFIDPYGLELSFSQNVTVSVISSVAATVGIAVWGPGGGAAVGAGTGFIASLAMGGDYRDAANNAVSGALSGLAGGYFGKLVKDAGTKALGTGFLFDIGTDAVLLGADPFFPPSNDDSENNEGCN